VTVLLPVYSGCQRPVAVAAVIVTFITVCPESNVSMSMVSIMKAEALYEDVLRFRAGFFSPDSTRGVGLHEAMKLCETVGLLGTQMSKEAYYP
jgi:hypothetical protein